jgi:hypothetical protein
MSRNVTFIGTGDQNLNMKMGVGRKMQPIAPVLYSWTDWGWTPFCTSLPSWASAPICCPLCWSRAPSNMQVPRLLIPPWSPSSFPEQGSPLGLASAFSPLVSFHTFCLVFVPKILNCWVTQLFASMTFLTLCLHPEGLIFAHLSPPFFKTNSKGVLANCLYVDLRTGWAPQPSQIMISLVGTVC